MDVKKNFMQAFKELTGNEEEEAAKAAEKGTPIGKPAGEEKPAFSSAFENIKAQYATGTATPPTGGTPAGGATPTITPPPSADTAQKKPTFTPPAQDKKPAMTPPAAPVKPAFTPSAPTPVTTPPVAPQPKPVEAPPVAAPVQTPPVADAFANTFSSSGSTSFAEEKTKGVKSSMERAIFHPDSPDISTEVTVLTAVTSIVGTITTSNSIVVDGKVNGDVETTHNITVTGRIEGLVKCKTADLFDCEIVGDINASEHVRISENTKVDGNIVTDSVEVDGKIKGNITARGTICIMRNALVIGDVSASKLSIEEGAMLQGNVSMKIN